MRFLIVFLLCPSVVFAGMVDLGETGKYSSALDINNSGVVVGYEDGSGGSVAEMVAVRWIDGQKQVVESGSQSYVNGGGMAMALNDKGVIVGSDENRPAIVVNDKLDYFSDEMMAGKCHDINEGGVIVGQYHHLNINDDVGIHGFLYDDEEIVQFGLFTECSGSSVKSVNNNGVAVGHFSCGDEADQAFLWQDGSITDLGEGKAFDINDNGVATGTKNGLPVYWKDNEAAYVSEEGQGIINGINSNGDMVGVLNGIATLWKNNGETVSLGTLGGSESTANAINNKGQIVGSSQTADNETHAFLWDEPEDSGSGDPGRQNTDQPDDNGDSGGGCFLTFVGNSVYK